MRVEGPLIVAQLLETTLLTLVNFARYLKESGNEMIHVKFYLVWLRPMLQDTALRLDQEKYSFWSLDFGEHKDLMEDYLLPNMLMLVSSRLIVSI